MHTSVPVLLTSSFRVHIINVLGQSCVDIAAAPVDCDAGYYSKEYDSYCHVSNNGVHIVHMINWCIQLVVHMTYSV